MGIVYPEETVGADGAARLQFDEPVAFEEQARTDLHGRVGVDRQPARFDFHVHEARACRRAGST